MAKPATKTVTFSGGRLHPDGVFVMFWDPARTTAVHVNVLTPSGLFDFYRTGLGGMPLNNASAIVTHRDYKQRSAWVVRLALDAAEQKLLEKWFQSE